MTLAEYVYLYDTVSNEEDPEMVRRLALYLIVSFCANDPNVSEEEAVALLEYSALDMDEIEETIH